MSTEDTSPASGGEHSTDDTQETTARRRRSPLIAASVAAAVLLAGGGAAYWASTASGGGDSGAGARPEGGPPPLALDGYATGKGTGSHAGIAPGEPDPSGSGYRATGKLPDGPSSAPVYQPRGQVSQEAVARLAKALDLPGQVRSDGDSWKVGGLTRDARSPVLQVAKSGSGAWTYSQYGTPNGTGCAESGKGSDSSQASGPGCRTGDESGEKDAVSPEKAKQAAQPVLAALGQKDAKLDASGLSGAVRTVSANPVIGGLPTYGWQSDIQVGSDGQIVGGSGQLAQPVKGDTYPVQSAQKTLERLNATHGGANSGIGGCATAEPQKQDKAGGQDVEPCVGNASARKPADVTGAVFGLSMQYVGGRPALVPSWLYTVQRAGGGTVTHPAVDPKYVKKGDGGASAQPPNSGKPSGKAGAMSLESYSLGADGKSLKLHFWGGVCSTYSATAEQTGKSVKAEVIGKDKKPNQICVKMAKEFTQTVPLDKPLAGRDVIDASSGKEVPAK
ncbi:hypothetical protein [Streptomyces rimosus]|uniref:hypothetical protein n=1 Tax=Streptomyces rimosus TaxID=1927 RepID=UPI0004BFF087|nr:hypothetical protein [Streptomyces rimosus]